MKTKSPKKIWIRTLQSGKIAVAEYRGIQRTNILPPFKPNPDTIVRLGAMIADYKITQKRDIVFEYSQSDIQARQLAKALQML